MSSRKKRRHPRARARGLSAHFNGPAGVATCRVEDISLGGLFLATDQELLPGTPLSLTLLKPGMKKGLQLPATVVNLRTAGPGRASGLGVRFDGLPADARSRLLVLLVELGVTNPVHAESDAASAEEPPPPPPAPAPAANTGFQVMTVREVDARGTPARGVPPAGFTPARGVPSAAVTPARGVAQAPGTPARGVSVSRSSPPPAGTPARGGPSSPTPPPEGHPTGVQTRGTPRAIGLDVHAPSPPPNATEVMSRDEVARHLVQTLGGDWGESTSRQTPPPAPLSSIPAAPYVPPVIEATPGGPSLTDRLQLQIRGLLLQLGEAEQKISTQEQELMQLRERLAELNATVRKKEAEMAQLRRESLR